MKKAGLQKNLKNHQRKCTALAVEVGKSFSPAAIHEFRIEYKKLRSFVELISFVSRDEEKFTIRKRAKKRYELSGRIRDSFLFLQRLRLMTSPGTVFLQENAARVKKVIRALKVEWKNTKPLLPVKKDIIRPSSRRFPDKVSLLDFSNYLENNEAGIFSVVNRKDLSDNQLHTLRKIVKERSYNLKWWAKQKGEQAVSSKIEKQMARLSHLMIDLGNYNDLVTFQLRLKKSGKRETNVARLKQLSLLQEKVKAEKQKINSNLVSEIDAVCRE
jgi:CHAD domain-containing protein